MWSARHRQAEAHPTQRHATGKLTRQRSQRVTPTRNAFALQVPRQAQQEVMAHHPVHLRQALATQRLQQLRQSGFQRRRREMCRQQTTDRPCLAGVLSPGAVTDLPQVQRQLPAQATGQTLQLAHARAHRCIIGELGCVQCPDHPVQCTPATQAAPLVRK
ncbi:hypothetical protein ALO72_200275 [Pseudomonas syringae pv. delphinii]|nr:hypothetical protein ALO72_200275 [Pseudomonas syringae pv. delphinii]